MAKRNMIKIAEEIRKDINPHYDLTFDELGLLYNVIVKRGCVADAIAAAFRYGYAMGCRATIKDAHKAAGKGGKRK